MSEPMIDLTLSLDELTERYGPENGTKGSFRLVGSINDPTTRQDVPVAFWSTLPGDPILAVTSAGRSRFVGDWTEGPRFVLRPPPAPPLKFERGGVYEEADGTRWEARHINAQGTVWLQRLQGDNGLAYWGVKSDGTPLGTGAPTLVRKVGRMVLEPTPSEEAVRLISFCEAEAEVSTGVASQSLRRIAELLRRVRPEDL